jgi:hypothetical protein
MSDYRENQLEGFIRRATSDLFKAEAKRLDEFVIQFFGSEEVARQHANEFVIEVVPVGPDFIAYEQRQDDNSITLFTETEYRIRRKTPEEISLETKQTS